MRFAHSSEAGRGREEVGRTIDCWGTTSIVSRMHARHLPRRDELRIPNRFGICRQGRTERPSARLFARFPYEKVGA